MKLVQMLSTCAFAVSAVSSGVGCAARPAVPASTASASVSTTELSSAEVGEKHAPTPKVGKVAKSDLSDLSRDSLGDEKRATAKDGERRSYEVFGDWK